MRWLIFLSRVAFICGLFMVLAFSLLFIVWSKEETLSSTIIMAGYGLAIILLPLTGIVYLALTIAGQKPFRTIPKWLFISNIILLLILLTFTFYINDPYYHQ